MSERPQHAHPLGGRLSIDFCNALRPSFRFTWDDLLQFLLGARIISEERSGQLRGLPISDPRTADSLLARAKNLQAALAGAFAAMVDGEPISREWIEPINRILSITEGHDELTQAGGTWRLEFVAREGGLDWLLAAVARSAAEIIAEGPSAPVRACANPTCHLFFYDTSRTKMRRWCSMARCGNRHKVASFSRRHAGVGVKSKSAHA